MTVNELKHEITRRLTPVVGAGEATAMMREMFYVLKGYSASDIVMHGDREVLDESAERAAAWAERIEAGEPLQYLTGIAPFMGMNLRVNPEVLIPRPETAQLVDLMTDDLRGQGRGLRIMDIGTGSGCIAIALARALPYADVTAVDISEGALATARANAREQRAAITVEKGDALRMADRGERYDAIVSNPPYIAERERADMDPRVYEHEPAGALFVPDDDPLKFHRAIARWAQTALAPGGKLYFEINPLFAKELRKMLEGDGWRDTDIIRDYKGNYRFAVCQR